MPRIRRLLLILCGALFAGSSGQPQIAPPRTVKVTEADDGRMHWLQPRINQEVIDAFSARVAASSRFTLTQDPPEILVVIVCQDGRKANTNGGFCTYRFQFSPKKIPEFDMPLGAPNIVFHADASQIAEDIFQDFIKETLETRLSTAEVEINMRVANFCSKSENAAPCSGKLQ